MLRQLHKIPIHIISFGCIFIFQINFSDVYSQAPEIIWQKCYGGSGSEIASSINSTIDNGFVVAGLSYSPDDDFGISRGYQDYSIFKIDSTQEIEWQKLYGGSNWDYGKSVVQTPSGNYLITGYVYSTDLDISSPLGGTDVWTLLLDDEGNLLWEKTFGGSSDDFANCVINTADENFVIAGSTYSTDQDVTGNHGGEDLWVFKIDIEGNLIWQKCLGGSEREEAYSIEQTFDGGYIVAGYTESSDGDVEDNNGEQDYWLVKLDSDGNIEWEENYGGTNFDHANSVRQTSDGGFIMAGEVHSSNIDVTGFNGGLTDFWVVKTDSIGNIAWQVCLGGSAFDDGKAVSIVDDGYVICGGSDSDDMDVSENKGENDYWVVMLDTLGLIKWEKSLGGSETETAFTLQSSTDAGVVIAGFTESNDGDVTGNHGFYDMWIVKLGFCTTHYYADFDSDGFGNFLLDSIACNLPVGYVLDSTDCNDADNLIHPFAEDICNAIDDNCNLILDEDAAFIHWFADADADGFGDEANDSLSCFTLAGFVEDSTDCNDAVNLIHPLAEDICNSIDDNCNLIVDEDAVFTHWFIDADEDGFGDEENDSLTCFTLLGYVIDSTDCNDANNLIYPGAEEVCNNMDDDCDGTADENLDFSLYFADADGDDYGNAFIDSLWCLIPFGYVADSTDCDDANPDIYPGAVETLNGLDDDCDELTDEGLAIDEILSTQINIYPNPADDILIVEYSGTEELEIEILNVAGQIIYKGILTSGKNIIAISTLPSGVYFMTGHSTDGNFNLKFVKE